MAFQGRGPPPPPGTRITVRHRWGLLGKKRTEGAVDDIDVSSGESSKFETGAFDEGGGRSGKGGRRAILDLAQRPFNGPPPRKDLFSRRPKDDSGGGGQVDGRRASSARQPPLWRPCEHYFDGGPFGNRATRLFEMGRRASGQARQAALHEGLFRRGLLGSRSKRREWRGTALRAIPSGLFPTEGTPLRVLLGEGGSNPARTRDLDVEEGRQHAAVGRMHEGKGHGIGRRGGNGRFCRLVLFHFDSISSCSSVKRCRRNGLTSGPLLFRGPGEDAGRAPAMYGEKKGGIRLARPGERGGGDDTRGVRRAVVRIRRSEQAGS